MSVTLRLPYCTSCANQTRLSTQLIITKPHKIDFRKHQQLEQNPTKSRGESPSRNDKTIENPTLLNKVSPSGSSRCVLYSLGRFIKPAARTAPLSHLLPTTKTCCSFLPFDFIYYSARRYLACWLL